MEPIPKAALAYHDRGWCVIPVRKEDKASLVKWKSYQERRPERRTIEKWFGNTHSGANVAIMMGPVSGGVAECTFFNIIPTRIPTLSEWGLIAMAGILGIVGFMVMRRRKVTA